MPPSEKLSYPVELKGVVRRFGARTVLDGIDLSLRASEFIAVLGPSGTGKTTLLRILAGVDSVDGGSVKLDQARSVVFQEPRLVPARRVWENVVLGERSPRARQSAERALAEVGLSSHADAWPKTLSGGEAQRVALARALVREPRLLLLDEPFASLDALTRIEMHELVRRLWQRHHPAVVLVTHDVDEAILLADRILVLSRGQVTLDLQVDLPEQRSKTTPAFDALRTRLLQELGVHGRAGNCVDLGFAADVDEASDARIARSVNQPAASKTVASRRRFAVAAVAASVAVASGAALSARRRYRPKLVVGIQTIGMRETVIASKVLDGLPFEVEWALLPGPAAQLSALYAESVDIGLGGSTSLIFEQAKPDWNEHKPPLQVVAIWQNPRRDYPTLVTAVRKSAGIKTDTDLRGKRWGYNYGGNVYGQYVASLVKAGLTEKDIQPARFVDANAAAAAFDRGHLDIISCGLSAIDAIRNGDAVVYTDNNTTGVPAHAIFMARSQIIDDERSSQSVYDFLGRVRQHWSWCASHVRELEEIYVKKLQLTPERARYFAPSSLSKFYPIDAIFGGDLQRTADLYYDFQAIPRRVQVASHLNGKYNGATVLI